MAPFASNCWQQCDRVFQRDGEGNSISPKYSFWKQTIWETGSWSSSIYTFLIFFSYTHEINEEEEVYQNPDKTLEEVSCKLSKGEYSTDKSFKLKWKKETYQEGTRGWFHEKWQKNKEKKCKKKRKSQIGC